MKPQMISIALVAALVGGGVGFFAGTKYTQGRVASLTLNRQANFNGGGRFFGAGGGRMMGFRPVSGEIISSDDKSITVKLADGSSKIVLFSDKTAINKAETGSKTDLTVGTKVAVFGQDNSDGSVTAQNIQINPIIRTTIDGGSPSPSPVPAKK